MNIWKNLLDALILIPGLIISIFCFLAEIFPAIVPNWVNEYVAPIISLLFIALCVAIIILAVVRKKRK